MSRRHSKVGAGAAVTLLAIIAITASNVLADTCCGTASVTFDRSPAAPGERVRVDGISCVEPAGGRPAPLAYLGRYWLTMRSVPAVTGDPTALDATRWDSFTSVPNTTATVGSATIVVPSLPPGPYTLWWACKSVPTADHPNLFEYSTGPPLVIELAATDTAVPDRGRPAGGWPSVILGIAGMAAALWWMTHRRRRPRPR